MSIGINIENHREHAVVIGGSMAGLLAARVLADHFERVTIIDRDTFPVKPEDRKGVPQARHAHLLLLRGQQLLEQFFPGLEDQLAQDGAPLTRWWQDIQLFVTAGWMLNVDLGYSNHICSRMLLEFRVRERLLARPNVKVIENCDVIGILANSDKSCVTGISYKSRDHSNQETLTADLIVDASGRNSHTPEWLKTLGYEPPKETIVDSFLGYSTRWYKRPATYQGTWKALAIQPRPPAQARAGAMFEIENGQWVVTLVGAARDYPPTDEAGYLEFARSLPSPMIYQAIKDAEPLTPISGYGQTQNRFRHYEQLSRWPDHFIVIGDAVCAFNPAYGQGMTVAALEALTLDECLSKSGDLTGMARRFQTAIKEVTLNAWLLTTVEDFRYPTTQGERPGLLGKLTQYYVANLMHLLPFDENAARAFAQTTHFLKPPTVLFEPRLFIQVIRHIINPRSQSELAAQMTTPQTVET